MFTKAISRCLGTIGRSTALNSQFAIQSGAVCSAKLINETNPKFNSIELEMDEAEILRIPLVWLRDHCRSPSNFNWDTNQRLSNPTNFFDKSRLANTSNSIEFDRQNQTLTLHWSDGHKSLFYTKELLEWAVFTTKDYDHCSSRSYWNKLTLKEIPSVSSKNFDFNTFSRLLLRFGVVSVTGVDARNERATKKLCEEIAPIQETLHGDFWVLGSEMEQKILEKNVSINHRNRLSGPHNDGTYLEHSLGIQTDKDIRLVDGFNAAQTLRHERPDLFDVLATTQIEHHYIEKLSEDINEDDLEFVQESNEIHSNRHKPQLKLHARSITKPVIECFKHKVVQVRFDPHRRAPLRTLRVVEFDEENARANVEKTVYFYEAYERFSQIVNDSNSAIELNLKPGTVIFVDNTRILHEFTEFQKLRRICGCYLSKDAFLAKARPILSATFKNI